MVASLASIMRGVGIVYIVVQVTIWHSFYTAAPWRLIAPVIAVAWAAVAIAYLRWRMPSPLVACVDCAVYLGLALGALGCVPPQVRHDTFNWLIISMAGQLIVPAWFGPDGLFLALAVASPVAYWASATLQRVTDAKTLAGAVILPLVIGLVHAYGRRELYSHAAAADAALNQDDQAASEQYAVLRRATERREHERLLHDTVLNTLTALTRSRGDDLAEVTTRCRRDVALMEVALSEHGDQPAGAGDPSPDLVTEIRAIAADMRARGLDVHVEAEDGGVGDVPARVAVALSNAVREALSNVAAHARTTEAWVQIRRLAQQAEARAPRGLDVVVRDQGAGFDLARVDQSRLGLSRSIRERAADCGGRASIWSQPGQGTVVRLSWPAYERPESPDSAGQAQPDRLLGRETSLW